MNDTRADHQTDLDSKKFFSVALCTYQGEAYIREQLQSIVDQTVPPAEIVIRDDGSHDMTPSICRELALNSPVPIRILPAGPRLGVARNFWTCAQACQSEWIVFSDQDDVWHHDRLMQFKTAQMTHPEAVAILSDGRIVDDSLRPTGQTLWTSHYFSPAEQQLVGQGRAEAVLARHVFVTGSALAVRKSWFLTVPEPTDEFYHDEWLGWFAGDCLRLLPASTFDYRQHQLQQTGVDTTWRARLQHLRESQAESRNLLLRDVRRFARLADQLDLNGLNDRASLVRSKISFINWRLNLPRFFPARLLRVLKKIIQGDYARFSILRRSLIKDLFFY